MNDITTNEKTKLEKSAAIWNSRLGELIYSKYHSQSEFAKAFKDAYGVNCSQRNVSRWLRVNCCESNGKTSEIIGFPSYSNMLLIADFFDVDVGYLTGETNAETFDCEKASDYLKLNPTSVKALKDTTNPSFATSQDALNYYKSHEYDPEIYQRIINILLINNKFVPFVKALCELDITYNNDFSFDWDDLVQKYGKEVFDQAFIAWKSEEIPEDEWSNETSIEFTEAIINALTDIEAINQKKDDQFHQREKDLCVYRYTLSQAFEELILNLYPTDSN